MEGRANSAAANDASKALKPPKSPPAPKTALVPVHEKLETYIVQIPRDQIYRVPPPENAKIVESYRTLPGKQKKARGSGWFIKATLVFLLILAIVCGITVGLILAFNKPIAPVISMVNIHVKNSTTPNSRHANPKYEILLKVENPNKRLGVSYEDGGATSISYKDKEIGEGKYPTMSQDAKESTNVHLTLTGTKSPFPKEAKTHVELSLEIGVPIKMKGMVSFTKNLKIICDFKVNTLGTGTKISSQDCISEI